MITIFPLIISLFFIIHVTEEYLQYEKIPIVGLQKLVHTKKSYLYSITFLGGLIAFFAIIGYFFPSHFLAVFNTFVLIGLGQHAIYHLGVTIYVKRDIPGNFSAVLLILPFCIGSITYLFYQERFTPLGFVGYFFISIVVLMSMLWIAVQVGNKLASYKK